MKIIKTCRLLFVLFAMLLTIPLYAGNGFTRLLTEDDGQDFLPVEKAFQVKAALLDASHAEVQFLIAPGHYLYRERIQIALPKEASIQVTAVKLPEGEEKNDPTFGKQFVFHHDTLATVIFAGGTPVSIQVKYQGCSEKGLCYPPQTKQIALSATGNANSLPQGDALTASVMIDSAAEDTNTALLHSGQWWKIVAGFFAAGLLLSFTPCVFPMIPILSGIIVGKQAHVSRTKALSLSLAYTFGMCLTYTLAGIAAGLSGQLLSQALQTPIALVTGALIFVLLALSMFGFYELKLPTAVENYFFNWSNRFKGGHLFSDFLMGAISALIISPCVAAPLAGALLYISQTHDVVLGGVALFSLSIGMGVPLLLIGASAGALLPKAGAWMNAVRRLFGVLMLAVAVWIISPILPTNIQLLLWSALCVIPAIYMRAIDPLPFDAHATQRLIKGLAIMLLVYGLILLLGAWSGASSPLTPLQKFVEEAHPVTPLVFRKVKNAEELDDILKRNPGKQVMLDFYADWCVSCKEYEQFVFANAQVKAVLAQQILLQADVTQNTEADALLLKRFGLFGPPGIIFFDTAGHQRTIIKGYQDADQFLKILLRLKENAHA